MNHTRLHNFTTRYVPREDRIIMNAISEDKKPYRLILTRRLLTRLLPKTYAVMLEKLSPATESTSTTAQNQGTQQSSPAKQSNKPVEQSSSETVILVDSASYRALEKGLILIFSDSEYGDSKFEIVFSYANYESWLSILQRLCKMADWPLEDFFEVKVNRTAGLDLNIH